MTAAERIRALEDALADVLPIRPESVGAYDHGEYGHHLTCGCGGDHTQDRKSVV